VNSHCISRYKFILTVTWEIRTMLPIGPLEIHTLSQTPLLPLFSQYPPIFWALGVLGSYSSATEVPLTTCRLLEFLQNSLASFSVMVSGGWFSWWSSCCTHLNTTSESLAAWLWYLEWSKNTYISYFKNLTPCRNVKLIIKLFILSFQMTILKYAKL
jgi:hypothetical protein